MKKFFAFFAVVVMALSVASLTTSCKKDIETAKSLAGTTWYNLTYTAGAYDLYTLKFTSKDNFELDMTGSKTMHGSGTFVVAGSKITFFFSSQSVFEWGETANGELLYTNGVLDRVTISGNVYKQDMPVLPE